MQGWERKGSVLRKANRGDANRRLAALVVEVEFLFAGDGDAVPGCRSEEPLLYCGDHCLVYGRLQAFEQSELGDLAVFVDDGIEDDIALGAMGECGEIRMRIRKMLQ
jgi:hypothetical protein